MIEVLGSKVTPTVLHCLDWTSNQQCHNALLLFQLSPLGFHSNKVVEIQCFKIKLNVNLWSSSVYGGFHIHINMNSTTRILWAIHNVGGSESKDCTTRTVWICFDRIWLLFCSLHWISTKGTNKLLFVLTSNSSSIVHGEEE